MILSSPTPLNPYASGTFSYTPDIYTKYSRMVAKATGQVFIDHGLYIANFYATLPAATVNSFFPNQTIHTSEEGARVVAQAFVRGLLCGPKGGLRASVNQPSSSVPGKCIT